jgi:hypothetical protein
LIVFDKNITLKQSIGRRTSFVGMPLKITPFIRNSNLFSNSFK